LHCGKRYGVDVIATSGGHMLRNDGCLDLVVLLDQGGIFRRLMQQRAYGALNGSCAYP
jgi:hypothetical protein